MRHKGAEIGRQQARKPSAWRPGSPGLYRPNPGFREEPAEKVWRALELTRVSASTLFIELIRRLEVDEEGWPLDEHGQRLFVSEDAQGVLPLTG